MVRFLAVKSPLYFDKNLPSGQLPPMLWRWPIGLLSQNEKEDILEQEHTLPAKLVPFFITRLIWITTQHWCIPYLYEMLE